MEYRDTFEALVIRDCSLGGGGKQLIIHADNVLRTEIFRVGDLVFPRQAPLV